MCVTCKPIRSYENIDTYEKLESIKEKASSLINRGTFKLVSEFGDPSDDYHETQFLCKDCGKVHVLWLHTFFCRTGGEWRRI